MSAPAWIALMIGLAVWWALQLATPPRVDRWRAWIMDRLTSPLVGDEPTEPLEVYLMGGPLDGETVPHMGFRAVLEATVELEGTVTHRVRYYRWNVASLPRRFDGDGRMVYYAENLVKEGAAWED